MLGFFPTCSEEVILKSSNSRLCLASTLKEQQLKLTDITEESCLIRTTNTTLTEEKVTSPTVQLKIVNLTASI